MRTLIFGTVLLSGGLAAAQTSVVRAHLIDQARVAPSTLQKAQHEAVLLASTAGITLLWVDWSNNTDFVFVVKSCDCGTGMATLGSTLLAKPHSSFYSYLYFKHVLARTYRTELSPADLLGAVIAHELGHLLGLQHGWKGVMAPRWTDGHLTLLVRGRLRFNEAEAQDMKAEIRLKRMLQRQDADPLALAARERPLP